MSAYVYFNSGVAIEVIKTGRTATPVIVGNNTRLFEVVAVANTIPAQPYSIWAPKDQLYKVDAPS